MSVVIKSENLSKAYQLGEIGTGTISRDLERWIARVRGKEDPFLVVGETNDRSKKGTSDVVWSLKDVNFEINQGDAIGIIGRNGAGKSTLLKLLSRVTAPTSGSVKIRGRVASLLEVGTGFHPELTGKENIFLNGAILGMRKSEIKSKFDAIVDFSGVERYIDTPVKRYSSGMYVRLAFAVAAHLESEILIVDEVLAVGDVEFQKKCLGKMGEVSKGEGRTVLFVSHNMEAVRSLCNKGMVLKNGQLAYNGNCEGAIERYLNLSEEIDSNEPYFSEESVKPFLISEGLHESFRLLSVAVKNDQGEICGSFLSNQKILVEAEFEIHDNYSNFRVLLNICEQHGQEGMVSLLSDQDAEHHSFEPGRYKVSCVVPAHILGTRSYCFDLMFYHVGRFSVLFHNPVKIQLQFNNPNLTIGGFETALFRPQFKWDRISI